MVLCGMVWYGVLWQHVIIGPNLVIGGLRLFRVDALLLCQLFYIRPFKISFAMIKMMRRVLMMSIIYNDECDIFSCNQSAQNSTSIKMVKMVKLE